MNILSGTFTDPIAAWLGEWSSGIGIWAIAFRVAICLIFSSIIGCERSVKRHSAGLRTFNITMLSGTLAIIVDLIICTASGSSLFILSAASVVSVALLSIHSMFYSSRNEIKGLTTAVALWCSALIGLAIGGGYYTVSLIFFLAMMCILSYLPAIETYLKNRSNHFEIYLELTNSVNLQDFVATLRKLGMIIDDIELNPAYAGSGLSVYSIAVSIDSPKLKKYKTHKEIIKALESLPYIYHIEEMH